MPPSPVKLLFTNLTPASGRQDHTTSPSARSALVSSAAYVHRIPCPTFVTIAKRPFVWAGMAGDREVICARSEPKYFCEGGWTGKSLDRDFWHRRAGRPHPEERPFGRVSKDGSNTWTRAILRDARNGVLLRMRAERNAGSSTFVIPGRAKHEPGIHTPCRGYRFPAHRFAMPRNDVAVLRSSTATVKGFM